MGRAIRKYHHIESEESPDMTPMLDIVFIMLIFFIVTSSFIQEEAIDWLAASNSGEPKESDDKPLVVIIDQTGQMQLQGRLVQQGALKSAVQAEQTKTMINSAIVSAHSSAPSGMLVKTVDDLKLAGIKQVSVSKNYR